MKTTYCAEQVSFQIITALGKAYYHIYWQVYHVAYVSVGGNTETHHIVLGPQIAESIMSPYYASLLVTNSARVVF